MVHLPVRSEISDKCYWLALVTGRGLLTPCHTAGFDICGTTFFPLVWPEWIAVESRYFYTGRMCGWRPWEPSIAVEPSSELPQRT